MRRYWIGSENLHGNQVEFSGELFHHIFDVCRQTLGSRFEVLAGNQKAYLVEVQKVEKKRAEAQIVDERTIPELPRPHLHVALSFSRYSTMEAVLEKCVEMGVHSFHPFYSEFSFLRSEDSFPSSKKERWNKIVLSATQQSGRGGSHVFVSASSDS